MVILTLFLRSEVKMFTSTKVESIYKLLIQLLIQLLISSKRGNLGSGSVTDVYRKSPSAASPEPTWATM